MESPTTKPTVAYSGSETSTQLFADWFDLIESMVRDQVRHFIQGRIEAELEEALAAQLRRRCLVAYDPGNGAWVGYSEDVYSNEQTGLDILIAVTLRQRSKTDTFR